MKSRYLLLPLVLFALFSITKPPKSMKSVTKELGDAFAYVPPGKAVVENDTLTVPAFFIGKGEVTNGEYGKFLDDLRANNEIEKLRIAQVDSLKWRTPYAQNEKHLAYHSHPAYTDFPVVNISYEGAQLYCEWLSAQYNAKTKIKNSGSGAVYQFRLPERAEFVRAARGDHHHQAYAWTEPFMRNSTGAIRCNHLHLGNENVHYNPETKKYEVIPNAVDLRGINFSKSDVTAPSISFWPNAYGVYNLNGNVAEMIIEKGKVVGGDWRSPGYDVRNESVKTTDGPASTTGFRVIMTVLQ